MSKISNTNNGKTLFLDNVQISYDAKSGKLFMMAKDKDLPNGFRMNVDGNKELQELARRFDLKESRLTPPLDMNSLPKNSFRLGYSKDRQIDVNMRENLYIVGAPGTGKTILTQNIESQAILRGIKTTRIDPWENGESVAGVLKVLGEKFVEAVLRSESRIWGLNEVLIIENLTDDYAPARAILHKIMEIENSGFTIILSDQYADTKDYLMFENRIMSTRLTQVNDCYDIFSDNPSAQEKFDQCRESGTGIFFNGEHSFKGYMPAK